MNKRLASSLLAAAMTVSVASVAAPALADTPTSPQLCGAYPAGQEFTLAVTPTVVTVSRHTNVILNSVLTRGTASDKACAGYLTGLFYTFAPNGIQQSKRTNTRGVAPFIANIPSSRAYFTRVYFRNNVFASNNYGQIHVAPGT